jgi:shikimate kinase
MGKSTVGPRVADALRVNYYDTDDWMEKVAGIDVPNLVKTDITAFRKLEADTLGAILEQEPGIISTGGGIVSTEVGRKALVAANAPVLWLRAPFVEAAKRVFQDIGRERPLFNDVDKARELYHERMVWYEETSTYVIDASQPVELVMGDIINIARSAALNF